MKPWRTWLACLGVVGTLAIISGCGGGDVPDPSSDGQAAAVPESTAPPQAPAPAAAPAQAVAAAPKAAAPEEKVEEPRTEVAAAQTEPPAAAEQPAAEKPAGPAAGGNAGTPDRGSATAEMLALATRDQAPPAAGGDAAQGGTSGPGGSSGGPGGPGGPGGSSGGPGGGPPRPPGANGPPGIGTPGAGGMAMGMPGQMQQQQMMRSMQNQMRPGGPGGPGMQGMPGGPGSAGGPGGSNQPPDFRTPEGAVQAFLDALKDHDLDRLTEATALRAQTEASKKYQEMFKRIFDSTLSESELNGLASKLDGYKISGENQAKSTGRLGVILRKQIEGNRGWLSLVITVRREKKGWGVCDIGETHEFKNQGFGNYKPKKKS